MIKIITATMVTLGRVATIAKIKSPLNFRLVDFDVIILLEKCNAQPNLNRSLRN